MVMGVPMAIEPHEAILECIRRVWGEIHYCDDRIRALTDEDAAAPVMTTHRRPRKFFGGSEIADDDDDDDDSTPVEERVGWVTEVKHGAPQLNVWIEARHQAYDRAVGYAKVALAAGVEERRVKAAEQWAAGYVELVKRLLEDLGHDLNAPGTREVVVKHLRLLDGGQGVTG
jgi:hypothetical protein